MAKDLEHYLALQYPVQLTRSPEGGYLATHPLLEGCMAEGETADDAVANLADSRELWIEARLANGYGIPEPDTESFSGRISLRMASSLHARLTEMAQAQDISLNLLINTVLAQHAGGAVVEGEVRKELQELRIGIREMSEKILGSAPSSGGQAPRPRGEGALSSGDRRKLVSEGRR